MARNTAVFVALVAALVISSVSAATHQVGDSLGWTVPGGAVVYSTWSSNNTFKTGDTLVFTFTSGAHDVAEVTKEAFDACNVTNPISLTTASPASLTLNTSGEHYYICTFSGHCNGGQKLAVNVTGTATSPSPAPTMTPPPASSPAPVPAPGPSSSASPPAPAPSSPAPTPSSGPATNPNNTYSPGTTPSPASDVTPPPSPNAATSLGVAGGLSATFLSIAAALFMF